MTSFNDLDTMLAMPSPSAGRVPRCAAVEVPLVGVSAA